MNIASSSTYDPGNEGLESFLKSIWMVFYWMNSLQWYRDFEYDKDDILTKLLYTFIVWENSNISFAGFCTLNL